MFFAYVLKNKQGRHYIGSCGNPELRLKQHNQNSVMSTKNKGPFRIVYKEEFNSITQARKRENELKSYKGNSKFRRLIEFCVPIV